MIQHRGSINNFFINSAYKLKKQAECVPNISYFKFKKQMCVFSKQQNNKDMYLKKPNPFFVKTLFFF